MTTQEKSRQGFWQSLFRRDEKQEPRQEVPEPVVETTVSGTSSRGSCLPFRPKRLCQKPCLLFSCVVI